MSWRPSASLASLKESAALRRCIREWMDEQNVLEVCTPVLSRYATTDPHVPSVSTNDKRYLHTSPEFPMKRLLAAHAQEVKEQPDIYQITPVFRAGESGRFHNPEFMLLEWYRVNMTHHELMDDTAALLKHIWLQFDLAWPGVELRRYGVEVFKKLHCWPEQADVGMIRNYFQQADKSFPESIGDDLDAALDLFMDEFVLSEFATNTFTFLKDYPSTQAALSRLGTDEDNRCVAERFELYFGAIELGNGFHELSDSAQQQQRFESDLLKREHMNQPVMPMDKFLIEALAQGLPDCAGIAIGLNRLHMALGEYDSISQVISFDDQRA